MKKYILTLITCTTALPLLAFNFDDGNFEIDANIKTSINAQITQTIDVTVRENVQTQIQAPVPDNEITSAIKQKIKFALKNINRNVKLRKRFPNRKFVEEQEIQKQRYENMVKWDIPSKIYTYIKDNFDLQRVEHVNVACKYVDETGVEVRFSYNTTSIIVSYNYTETPWKPSITHRMFK